MGRKKNQSHAPPVPSIHSYRLLYKLGSGAFGTVYLAAHSTTHALAAVKLEPTTPTSTPTLLGEAEMTRFLSTSPDSGRPVRGIPFVHWAGPVAAPAATYFAAVLDYLGPSLADIVAVFSDTRGALGEKSVLMVADAMISRLEYVHARGVVHCDIKPENFLFGRGNAQANILFLVDFGLAETFRDPDTGEHRAYREFESGGVGSARYCSVPAMDGVQLSRRDDLVSIGYVLVELMKGALPWVGVGAKAKTPQEKVRMIRDVKDQTLARELCEGLDQSFFKYVDYCENLGYDEKPDYAYLRRLFRDLFLRRDYLDDNVFDWSPKTASAS